MVSVTMPRLGESVVEGTVTRWLKREGERVEAYEPLVEVITDKVNSELPSPAAGVVARISVPEGQTVRVGAEMAVIEPTSPASLPASSQGSEPGAPARPETRPHRSSPLVRRLAREHGVEVSAIQGTGADGRVRKEDLLAHIQTRSAQAHSGQAHSGQAHSGQTRPGQARPGQTRLGVAPDPPGAPLAASAPSGPLQPRRPPEVDGAPHRPGEGPPAAGTDEEPLPLTAVRRAIAEHMVRSVTTAPHAWTYVEADVNGLVKWREAVRAPFRAREGFDLTYLPFVAKAVVETLREHPILNSTWRDGQVILKKRIHLGVAIALEDGLVVPVIRDADSRSVAGLARALDDLVTRARKGQLTPDDVREGTFTLNNTGALGSVLSMPIINQPQAAILTMEAIVKRVVVLPDDAIAVRPRLNLCLSFDHRVCDGLPVGRFLQGLKGRLEAMTPEDSLS